MNTNKGNKNPTTNSAVSLFRSKETKQKPGKVFFKPIYCFLFVNTAMEFY